MLTQINRPLAAARESGSGPSRHLARAKV